MDTTVSPPSSITHPDESFPKPFGRYRLLRRLGAGGMATVYLAFDTLLERGVALKIPHPHLVTSLEQCERFYREARAAARLSHPNLCPVLDLGQVEGVPFLTMPFIEGVPLSQHPTDDPRQGARVVKALARAMAVAHRLHVIHRDLKPANVLITPGGEPVVTDFGVALRLDADTR